MPTSSNQNDRSSPLYRHFPRGATAQGAVLAIQALDRLIAPLSDVAAPVSAALSRRSLWGMLPRQPAAADPEEKLLALSFDLDYQADTNALPSLVELVDRVGARMTLFCIGKLVVQDPAPYRQAARAGHEIANHTWSHPDNPVLNPDREFWDLSVDNMMQEIGRAQDVFDDVLGVRPSGFRTPHFKDAPRMMEALEHFPEIDYVSTTLASQNPIATPYFPTRRCVAGEKSLHFSSVNSEENSDRLMIPLTPCPEHRWTPFCSYHAIREPANPDRGAGMHGRSEFEALWTTMLKRSRADGFASVYFDPMDVMRSDETAAVFERMLTSAIDRGWRLTTLADIAGRWRRFLTTTSEPSVVSHTT